MDHHTNVAANYHKKDFSSCLKLIDKAPRGIRELSHYRVLKASCLVNLGNKINEAHRLLDGVIATETENAFAYYVKGLAFMHERKFREAAEFFDKAIKHDKTGSMQKASEMKDEAIKMMANDGVGGNKENIVSDAMVEEEKPTMNIKTNLTTTMTAVATKAAAKVIEVGKVQEEKKPQDDLKTCNICSKSFTKAYSLTRHKAVHTGNRPFKCANCNYAFIQKSDLKRHEVTHTDEFNFKCTFCTRVFQTKKSLQGHQLVHSSDRPHDCKVCSKTFKLESMLKFHQNLHKPEKDFSFKCDTCGKTFPTKTHINSHIKAHFNAKLFACNLCKFTYSTIARFGHHFREFHVIGKGNV